VEIARLTAEHMTHDGDPIVHIRYSALRKLEQAEADVTRLREFVQHKRDCGYFKEATPRDIGEWTPGDCTCGLASLRQTEEG
jgi:hypothetical protein